MTVALATYAGIIVVLFCAAMVARKMRETNRLVRRAKFLDKFAETRASHEADRRWRFEHPEIMEEKDDDS